MMTGCFQKQGVWAVLTVTLAAGAICGAAERAAFEAALVLGDGVDAPGPLRIVLLADKKDHGPSGNGLHDYPLWQERWALLLGGRAASDDAEQVNLHGPAITDAALEEGAPGVSVERASGWPPTPPFDAECVTVLAVCRENNEGGEQQPQPMLWTFAPGKGRVFGCVPGHRAATFDDPWFRLAVLRGIAWAAGGSPYRFDRLAPRGERFDGPVK